MVRLRSQSGSLKTDQTWSEAPAKHFVGFVQLSHAYFFPMTSSCWLIAPPDCPHTKHSHNNSARQSFLLIFYRFLISPLFFRGKVLIQLCFDVCVFQMKNKSLKCSNAQKIECCNTEANKYNKYNLPHAGFIAIMRLE